MKYKNVKLTKKRQAKCLNFIKYSPGLNIKTGSLGKSGSLFSFKKNKLIVSSISSSYHCRMIGNKVKMRIK